MGMPLPSNLGYSTSEPILQTSNKEVERAELCSSCGHQAPDLCPALEPPPRPHSTLHLTPPYTLHLTHPTHGRRKCRAPPFRVEVEP